MSPWVQTNRQLLTKKKEKISPKGSFFKRDGSYIYTFMGRQIGKQ